MFITEISIDIIGTRECPRFCKLVACCDYISLRTRWQVCKL